jgi:FlaA1/EpsC-like NDP-sugar epimerase
LPHDSNDRWNHVLPAQEIIGDSTLVKDHVTGKTILLTGAGGCIGSALAKRIVLANPPELLLLDHSEQSPKLRARQHALPGWATRS